MIDLLGILFFVAILGSAIFLHITDDSEVDDNPASTKTERRQARAKPVLIGFGVWLLVIGSLALLSELNGAIVIVSLLVCIIGSLL